jgi:hypothetical protein
MNPPCYHQPDSDSLASRDRFNQRPRVTLQSVWDPDTAAGTPSYPSSPSPTASAPSPARRRFLENSRSEDERSAYTARTDFSSSDPGSITPSTRPLSIFASLTVEQLLKQRQELESAVSQLQEESQSLRITNSDMEQVSADLVGYLEQLQSRREEAIAEYTDIEEQIEKLRRDLQSLRTELAGSCAARDAARVDLENTRTAHDTVRNELHAARDLISEAKKALADVVSERDSAKSQLDSISRSRADVSLELAAQKAELHQNAEVSRLEQVRLADLRRESATATKTLEQAQLQLSDVMRRNQREESDARGRIADLHAKAEADLKSKRAEAFAEEQRQRTALGDLQRSISNAQRQQEKTISQLNGEKKVALDALAKIRAEFQTVNTDLVRERRAHVDMQAAVVTVTDRKRAAEVDAQKLEAEASRTKAAILQAQQQLNALELQTRTATVASARIQSNSHSESLLPPNGPSTPHVADVQPIASSVSGPQSSPRVIEQQKPKVTQGISKITVIFENQTYSCVYRWERRTRAPRRSCLKLGLDSWRVQRPRIGRSDTKHFEQAGASTYSRTAHAATSPGYWQPFPEGSSRHRRGKEPTYPSRISRGSQGGGGAPPCPADGRRRYTRSFGFFDHSGANPSLDVPRISYHLHLGFKPRTSVCSG